MSYIIEHEGALSLFKGIGPQLLKGLLVQGLLMMTKERYDIPISNQSNTTDRAHRVELGFILLFRYVRKVRAEQLAKLASIASEKARLLTPVIAK